MRLCVCSGLVVGLCFACNWFAAGDPKTKIDVSRERGRYEFKFRTCGQGYRRLGATRISVTRLSDGSSFCEVSLAEAVSPVTEWRYGTIPKGYASDGCQDLMKGERYQIGVSTIGEGKLVFELESDGTLLVQDDSC